LEREGPVSPGAGPGSESLEPEVPKSPMGAVEQRKAAAARVRRKLKQDQERLEKLAEQLAAQVQQRKDACVTKTKELQEITAQRVEAYKLKKMRKVEDQRRQEGLDLALRAQKEQELQSSERHRKLRQLRRQSKNRLNQMRVRDCALAEAEEEELQKQLHEISKKFLPVSTFLPRLDAPHAKVEPGVAPVRRMLERDLQRLEAEGVKFPEALVFSRSRSASMVGGRGQAGVGQGRQEKKPRDVDEWSEDEPDDLLPAGATLRDSLDPDEDEEEEQGYGDEDGEADYDDSTDAGAGAGTGGKGNNDGQRDKFGVDLGFQMDQNLRSMDRPDDSSVGSELTEDSVGGRRGARGAKSTTAGRGVGAGAGVGETTVHFSPRAPALHESPRRPKVGAVRVGSPGSSPGKRMPPPLPAQIQTHGGKPELPALRGQAPGGRDEDNVSASPKKKKPFKKLRPITMSMPYQPAASVGD